MKEFYQYYIKYFSEYAADEMEAEGVVCADSFMDALKKAVVLYDEILSVELINLGSYLEKDTIDELVWRTDKDYTAIDDCDSCKI